MILKSPLVHFFMIAGLCFLVNSVYQYNRVDTPVIVLAPAELKKGLQTTLEQLHSAARHSRGIVNMQADGQSLELNALSAVLDEKILLVEGVRIGLLKSDPVIIERLLKNMAFTADVSQVKEANSPENGMATYQQAIALGMDKSDPVIQRRILLRVKQMIRNNMPLRNPSDAQLQVFIDNNPDTFRQPAKWRFTQYYYDPLLHPEGLYALMQTDKEKLLTGESEKIGDSSILPRQMGLSSQRRISQQFGRIFANEVKSLDQVGEWVGPVESSYGQHWLRLDEKVEGDFVTLDSVRKRATQGWLEQQKDAFYQQAMLRMRNIYHISVTGYATTTVADFTQQWLNQG